jgi:long-subunit acyl-CoA synthetase (AMP-forming)
LRAGPDAVQYTINHSDIRVVICEKRKLQTVLASAEQCPSLKYVIVMSDATPEMRAEAQAKNLTLLAMTDVEATVRDAICPVFAVCGMLMVCVVTGP